MERMKLLDALAWLMTDMDTTESLNYLGKILITEPERPAGEIIKATLQERIENAIVERQELAAQAQDEHTKELIVSIDESIKKGNMILKELV